MMYNLLIEGLKESDFMTLRWNAEVHTVHTKTGEYRILNNRGAYLGEIVKEGEEKYRIVFCGNMDKEIIEGIERVKNVSKMIMNRQLKTPEYQPKKILTFSPRTNYYQKNSQRYAA